MKKTLFAIAAALVLSAQAGCMHHGRPGGPGGRNCPKHQQCDCACRQQADCPKKADCPKQGECPKDANCPKQENCPKQGEGAKPKECPQQRQQEAPAPAK